MANSRSPRGPGSSTTRSAPRRRDRSHRCGGPPGGGRDSGTRTATRDRDRGRGAGTCASPTRQRRTRRARRECPASRSAYVLLAVRTGKRRELELLATTPCVEALEPTNVPKPRTHGGGDDVAGPSSGSEGDGGEHDHAARTGQMMSLAWRRPRCRTRARSRAPAPRPVSPAPLQRVHDMIEPSRVMRTTQLLQREPDVRRGGAAPGWSVAELSRHVECSRSGMAIPKIHVVRDDDTGAVSRRGSRSPATSSGISTAGGAASRSRIRRSSSRGIHRAKPSEYSCARARADRSQALRSSVRIFKAE